MKTFLFLLFILAMTYLQQANACQLSIPESYIPTFLAPPVSGAYMKCEEKPEEKCFCVDEVDPWSSDFITEITQDDLGINIETKVLKNSESKKALRLAEKEAEKLADDEKKVKRKAAKDKVKSFKFKGSTIKELREELNEFADGNSKAQDE